MKKLSEIEVGARFYYGGVEWIKLQRSPIFCIAADVLKEEDGDTRYIPFDTENRNNFASSSLRAWLNGAFLNELIAAGADIKDFIYMTIDLTSDDGLDDYGSDIARVGLITCEMYRKFRKLIPYASDWWWTCTPFSTANSGYSRSVRHVNSSGALRSNHACHGLIGVRPTCFLRPDTLVSCDGEPSDETATLADKHRETLGLLERVVDKMKALLDGLN